MTLPKNCPVTVLSLRAKNDSNGNPQRCFVVLDRQGHFVEAIDEGYSGRRRMTERWPWFDDHDCGALGIEPSYDYPMDVTPAEYKAQLMRGPDSRGGGVERLRKLAVRNAQRAREARKLRSGF